MDRTLSRSTRIGLPRRDGTLVPGVILGLAFGEGFYCASLAYPTGSRIVCLHSRDVVIDPAFADLRAAAATMRERCSRDVTRPGPPFAASEAC